MEDKTFPQFFYDEAVFNITGAQLKRIDENSRAHRVHIVRNILRDVAYQSGEDKPCRKK